MSDNQGAGRKTTARRRDFIPECRDCQIEAKMERRTHIAKLIIKQVRFFNGWSVSEGCMEGACLNAANKILRYLDRREKRRNL